MLHYPHFGILYREKSGNPASNRFILSPFWYLVMKKHLATLLHTVYILSILVSCYEETSGNPASYRFIFYPFWYLVMKKHLAILLHTVLYFIHFGILL
jgi:hypothetical protein